MKQKESFVSFFVKFGVLSLVSLLLSVCFSCGSGGEKGTSDTIIPETTKVISKEEASGILEMREDGTILLDKTSPVVDKFKQGNVVVSEPIEKAPYGFLRKVVSVNEAETALEVQTTQTALDEAIEEGEIKSEITLKSSEVASFSLLVSGLSIKKSALTGGVEAEFPFEFNDVVLYDEDGDENTTFDQIVANGEAQLSFGFVFEAKIKSFNLKYFKFGPKVSESAELNISTEIPILDVDYKKEVAHYVFTPITIWVGIVPIVLVPELSVYVGVNGNISFKISANITQELGIEAGLKYENSKWQTYKDFTADFIYTPFDITAGGTIKGYLGPELKLKLYGVAGPFAFINGYLELEADLTQDPWWTLYGGVEGKAGAKIEILSHLVAYFETDDFIGYKKILAQAETKPCTPDCAGKECGDNGCEGSCGECNDGYNCDENFKCAEVEVIVCGNGKCEAGENCNNCSDDCGDCPISCGNGNCDEGESYCNCASDCPIKCGDGCCSSGEDFQNCLQDCQCVPNCEGKECGDNGCGGSCGSCPDGYNCQSDKCVKGPCQPNCAGKECGVSDGCGGSCGCDKSFNGKDNGDGTVTDLTTGLMWEKKNKQLFQEAGGWYSALQYCDNLVLAGYSDWRLPNIDELRTLIIGCSSTMAGGNCDIYDGFHDCCSCGSACGGCDSKKGLGLNGCYIDELLNPINAISYLGYPCAEYWSFSWSSPQDCEAKAVFAVFFDIAMVGSVSFGSGADPYVAVLCVR